MVSLPLSFSLKINIKKKKKRGPTRFGWAEIWWLVSSEEKGGRHKDKHRGKCVSEDKAEIDRVISQKIPMTGDSHQKLEEATKDSSLEPAKGTWSS